MTSEPVHDAIVCGAGPAGLSSALWLGRYRRRTLVFDSGRQRNLSARATHGYLSRDGSSPGAVLEAGRADVGRYDSVRFVDDEINQIRGDSGIFVAASPSGSFRARRVVLATGVKDVFPRVTGFDRLYGDSIFHCSCCDGFEARDRVVLAIGWGPHSAGYAIDLLEWGARVTLVTNGERFEGDREARVALERNGIELIEENVEEFVIDGGTMTHARLESGRLLRSDLAFFSIAHEPRAELARELGCSVDAQGYVVVDDHGQTSVEGVFAAGDVTPGEQLIQIAASQGALAGITCAMSLRGTKSLAGGPDPGPDPERELRRAGSSGDL